MRILLFILLILYLPAYGKSHSNPSFWVLSEGSAYSELVLYRSGNTICGTIQQGSPTRSISGRFVGKTIKEGFLVTFDDSFAKENDFGHAIIKITKGTLIWQVNKRPADGYLADFLKLAPVKTLPPNHLLTKNDVRQCKSFNGNTEEFFSKFGSR